MTRLRPIRLSVVSFFLFFLSASSFHYAFAQSALAGDLNGDGILDLADHVFMLQYQNHTVALDPRLIQSIDFNRDGKIDVQDDIRFEILLTERILQDDPSDFIPLAPDAPNLDALIRARITEKKGAITIRGRLSAPIRIAAIFYLVKYEDGLTDENANFTSDWVSQSVDINSCGNGSTYAYGAIAGYKEGSLSGSPIEFILPDPVAPSPRRPVPFSFYVQAVDAQGKALRIGLAPPLAGDVNGDGVVDLADVALSMKIALGLVSPTLLDDANGDGLQDLTDARMILNLALVEGA